MTIKRKQKKSKEKPLRLPPIVIVPDKTYVDDTNHLIVTDAIVVVAPVSHRNLLNKMTNREGVTKVRLEG